MSCCDLSNLFACVTKINPNTAHYDCSLLALMSETELEGNTYYSCTMILICSLPAAFFRQGRPACSFAILVLTNTPRELSRCLSIYLSIPVSLVPPFYLSLCSSLFLSLARSLVRFIALCIVSLAFSLFHARPLSYHLQALYLLWPPTLLSSASLARFISTSSSSPPSN